MGTIIAIIAHELNTITIQEHQAGVNTIMDDKPKPEENLFEELLRENSDNDRDLEQNEVIKEIQELENCANFY